MFSDFPRVVRAAALADAELTRARSIPAGRRRRPRGAALGLHDSADLAIGVWQHGVGVSTDVEADEIFVVLSGRATIEVEDGPTLEVGPGDVGLYPAGTRTRWTVHETLRKVYVVRP